MKTPRLLLWSVSVALLVALPPLVSWLGQPFYIDLVRRIMILAIAAVSLNLILGYGGMVSFGHAAYLGIGAYAVGILGVYGFTNGLLHWAVATGASALVALAIGAVSIRTSGIYFIMITLAFTQMLYYLGISLELFGGDDGMRLKSKSQFGGLVDLRDPVVFYYLSLVLMLGAVFLVHRIVNSRFGMVIQGARSNDRRMRAIGFPTYRYKLICFVIAGTICGLAGALLANHTDFISPAVMHWTRSGDLIVMAVLGGMGTVFGPVIGAVALLVLEEVLSGVTEYWQIIIGPIFLLVVLFARGGIDGMLLGARRG